MSTASHDSKETKDEHKPAPRSAYSGMGAGYVLLASALVGFAIGYSIDAAYDTRPLWTALMSALFIVAGLYQVVKENWPRD